MPVQKQHHTRARRDRARVMLELKKKKLVACPKCSAKIVSHKACPKCGYYKGKEAMDTMKRANRKAKNKK